MQFAKPADGNKFSQDEEEILAYWKSINAFETSLKQSEGKKEYTFYDGPPFATGLPHYGHILAGTIKDVVTRYAHQTGHHVSRRFGWDTHGLPVEFEIDKKLGIETKEDVAAMGIDRYNAECRAIVQRYSKEWEVIVNRMGRWIDFENDYKTLDPSFMESVWWVFKTMYDKGHVYRGFKVMPYSTTCTTPLSNFEAGQNYKDVRDPAVVVSLPVLPGKEYAFLAWTTTPWTLPSNLGLCVHPEMDYVKVKDSESGALYVLAKARLDFLYPEKKGKKKSPKKAYKILEEMKGADLKGLRYEPLFPYFASQAEENGAFQVLTDTYVTSDSGTGVVHQAPAFGEDDYRVCLAHGIIKRGADLVCPVDDNGNFTDDVADFKGRYVKEADRDIIRFLKSKGRLIKDDQLLHSYPHCWRSDNPLIYKAVPSWFVNVPSIREKLVANNNETYWVPSFVKEKRFHNWLSDARDWAVSRNRYWGTPIPIWTSEDGEEIVVIGSVQELKDLSGVQDITDLHRDSIDHITIPSKKGKGVLKRVPEVFDCWFESGSMPYAQQHYPFENKEKFENGFPADFIAEGLDQTRGWFYTLMVISTALFDKPAFKNLIVNGLVLASDGKKMSKRLKNYPDPMEVVDNCGADALRLYLINSPVVRAEPLRFQDAGVRDVVKDIFIPWYGVYTFFISQCRRNEQDLGERFTPDPLVHKHTDNVMDKWILSSLQTLIKNVRAEMAAYRLYTVIPHLLSFVDQLSKWYLRFNKGRLKGDNGLQQSKYCLATLFKVLFECCRLMAPFTPFLVEKMYQNLKNAMPASERQGSVHFLMIPEVEEDAIDTDVERRVSNLQLVVELGRQAREQKPNMAFRVPCPEVTVYDSNQELLDDICSLEAYVLDASSLNCRKLVLSTEASSLTKFRITPDRRALGRRFGKTAPDVFKALEKLDAKEIATFMAEGKMSLEVGGEQCEILASEVQIEKDFVGDTNLLGAQSSGTTMVVVNKKLDESCQKEGTVREVMSIVQQARKFSGLNIEDKVDAWYETADKALARIIDEMQEFIIAGIRVPLKPFSGEAKSAKQRGSKTKMVEESEVTIYLTDSVQQAGSGGAPAAPAAGGANGKKNKKKSNKKKKKGGGNKKETPAIDEEKLKKEALKEGGKKGQDICGLADMGGVRFFTVTCDAALGRMDLLELCLEGFNKDIDPEADDRKGGAKGLAKMLFSHNETTLSIIANLPKELQDKTTLKEWVAAATTALEPMKMKVVGETEEVIKLEGKTDIDAGIYAHKKKDECIGQVYHWLTQKALVMADDSDGEDIVYGDDDLPDYF